MVPFRSFTLIAFLSATVLGCRDTKVVSYRVPKESPDAPNLSSTPTANRPLRWTAPAGWAEQPAVGPRAASFTISGDNGAKGDVSVIAFPGDVGGDLANLNRWRGQLGLGPITEAELAQAFTAYKAPSGEFRVVDLSGQAEGKAARILGAVLREADRTWFIKLMGDDKLVADQRGNFESFLKSLEFSSEPAAGALPSPLSRANDTNNLPRASASMPVLPATPPAETSSPPPLSWQAPASWKEKPPSSMRLGSYAIPGSEPEGDLSVIAFPGDAGGLLENVNRWRGQLKLSPLNPAQLPEYVSKLEANGLSITLVNFSGTGSSGPSAMIGAIIPFGGQTWFFKLTGPESLVAAEKNRFIDFIKTVKAR